MRFLYAAETFKVDLNLQGKWNHMAGFNLDQAILKDGKLYLLKYFTEKSFITF